MQRVVISFVFLILVSVFFSAAIHPAKADALSRWEGFVDVYGGYSKTADDTVDATRVTTNFITVSEESASRSVSYDPSFTVGARVGTYFQFIGGALDISYFEANDSSFENNIVSISGLLMLRAQLFPTDNVPRGQFQPYLAVGPGYFMASHDVNFQPDISGSFELTDGNIGIDARAGVRWLFNKNLGLFAEYRVTHFGVDSENDSVTINGRPTESVKTTMTTQHVLGGLTFSF